MKIENFKEEFQFSLDNCYDSYQMKSDEEILEIISNFGCGETQFHTADIERIIREKQALYDLLNKINEGILINSTVVKKALEFYKP